MSQKQAAIILANAFFCTFDESARAGNYNFINFSYLYKMHTHKASEKLQCLLAYFETLCTEESE